MADPFAICSDDPSKIKQPAGLSAFFTTEGYVSYLHARPLDGAFTRDPVGVPLPTTGGGQSWSETIVRARRWSALAVSMREGLPWFRSDSLCAREHGRQDGPERSGPEVAATGESARRIAAAGGF